jgi:hypothetical protein
MEQKIQPIYYSYRQIHNDKIHHIRLHFHNQNNLNIQRNDYTHLHLKYF